MKNISKEVRPKGNTLKDLQLKHSGSSLQQQPYSKQTTSQADNVQMDIERQAFVTGLKEDSKEPHERVQDQLEKYVEGIDGQFQNILIRHENDFINAYKSHMAKVQKELLYLKNKANEAAGKILNDDSITTLQKQIDWFKNEALKLDSILENQKREIQKHKSRELNLGEDRKFLKTQIKEAMKHNKLLEVAVKKTNETNSALKEFLSQNQIKEQPHLNARLGIQKRRFSPSEIINQTMQQYNEPFITQQQANQEQINIQINNQILSRKQISQDLLSLDSQDFKVREFVLDLFRRGYSRDKIESKIAKFFKLYDQSRDNKIEGLHRRIELLKKNNTKNKTSQVAGFSEKSEVENLFLDCVDESKKEVLKKKTLLTTQTKFQNNYIQENTQQDSQDILEQVVLSKEALIGVFEEMFGSGGYVGTVINNIEHQIKNKKYSLVSQGIDTSMGGFMSNATTKDNQSEEHDRVQMIMNAPIENLLSNLKSYSYSQSKIGIRKHSQNSYGNKRASTANAKNSALNYTAISNYNDQSMDDQQKPRPYTSQSQNRSFKLNDFKSRQGSMPMKQQSKDRSFSVRNGKLVMHNTNTSSSQQ